MAYDAATGEVVLFGGYSDSQGPSHSTWTWNGTTWTKEHPATFPHREYSAMAYDAATGTVVLFGGSGSGQIYLSSTWTWNGTTWTKQAPPRPTRLPGTIESMAYDAATGTVVLFGGRNDAPSACQYLDLGPQTSQRKNLGHQRVLPLISAESVTSKGTIPPPLTRPDAWRSPPDPYSLPLPAHPRHRPSRRMTPERR